MLIYIDKRIASFHLLHIRLQEIIIFFLQKKEIYSLVLISILMNNFTIFKYEKILLNFPIDFPQFVGSMRNNMLFESKVLSQKNNILFVNLTFFNLKIYYL